jgi:Cu+-exporting ATPase
MTCASCVNVIETYVGDLVGVQSIVVALLQECATVRFDPSKISVRKLRKRKKKNFSYVAFFLKSEQVRTAIEDVGFTAEKLAQSETNSCRLVVKGMTCASCVAMIESVVGALTGFRKPRRKKKKKKKKKRILQWKQTFHLPCHLRSFRDWRSQCICQSHH